MANDDVDAADQSALREEDKDDAVNDPLAGIPELTTFTATGMADQIEGLKLIADSVAQQRQTASSILISHPINVLLFGAILAGVAQYLYKGPSDLPVIFTTFGGLVMAGLVGVRTVTKGYIARAEDIGFDWLGDGDNTLIVTRFGDITVGACVVGWERGEKGTRRKKSGRGLVRAWTVKLRYRRRGVGRALLEEAVDLVNQKGGDGIVFADDHASMLASAWTSKLTALTKSADCGRVLRPEFFNATFDRKEAKARAMLDDVAAERGAWKKR